MLLKEKFESKWVRVLGVLIMLWGLGNLSVARGEEIIHERDVECSVREVELANKIGTFMHISIVNMEYDLAKGLAKSLKNAKSIDDVFDILRAIEMMDLKYRRWGEMRMRHGLDGGVMER